MRKFRRQGFMIKKLGTKWRRPRGKHSKLRKKWKGKGNWPHPGYRTPNSGKHPCGLYEVMVNNMADLAKIDAATQCARIAAAVGAKKKTQIVEEATKMKIKVLNPTVNRKGKE